MSPWPGLLASIPGFQTEPLDQSVFAAAVVTATPSLGAKAQRAIQGLPPPVARRHLQSGAAAAHGLSLQQQGLKDATAQALPLLTGINRHQRDVQLIEDHPARRDRHKRGSCAEPQAGSIRFSQLPLPLRLIPQTAEGQPVEGGAGLEIVGREWPGP